ncbi:hybrid sensor histidine kinase/response regulator [Deinococcus sp. KNUC1210]|uniref:hybrid sensor histidine kinase/response regulator n=1 Tax=Deinococcus sp. KNUC1210 TaxID=2917691 RepID=UPI001EEF9AE1|nr:hybrid sensor histidine kinase/response regulator [Deinococcus sp. KNUC1210]ULH16719.1 hybrid sensor histidine kinase/response regulator [Deinococcus sp. KNUC1210]
MTQRAPTQASVSPSSSGSSSVSNQPWTTPGGLTQLRVLHLEDNLLDHELVRSALEDQLTPVPDFLQAEDEASFRAALTEFRPHLIISDFSLPTYDGLSAFELAHSVAPHLPFIIVTGAMGEEVAVDTLRRGVTDYVLKQRLERLAPAVRRALSEFAERERRRLAEAEIRGLNLTLQARLRQVEQLNAVAEERRLQQEDTARQLAESLNLQKTFLAETSHELRTPLTALLGYLRRLEREVGVSQTLSDALRVAQNMTRLVNDLLQLTRGELVQSIEPHFVDLAELLHAVGRDYGVAVQTPPLEIVADPGRLTQVFVNLVGNAVRVCGSPALVSIQAYQQGKDLCIEIIDHGPGIPDEVKPRIFDKFYRGKEAGSAGLGLTIAQQVITAHRGSLSVKDTPGGGATFEVCLPALDESEEDDLELLALAGLEGLDGEELPGAEL